MSKKKIFKQKIKEMLAEMEKKPSLEPVRKPEITQPKVQEEATPKPLTQPSTLTPIPIVKSDLKKIALLFGLMTLFLISLTIISNKTNWLLFLSEKLFKWAQLG